MLISVITTTFNRKNLLAQTIDSVQLSAREPVDFEWEHVVYDDGSTDGTENIFVNTNWKNIVYLRNKTNKGQSTGKNEAVRRARGDFLFFIDSDDIMPQRVLYNFANKIISSKSKKDLWFVTDFFRVDDSLRYLPGKDYYAWEFKDQTDMLRSIFAGEHFIQANSLFSKDLFNKVGGFDENIHMGEDIDLYIRFLFSGAIPKILPIISHLHRDHDSNISSHVDLKKHKLLMREFTNKYSVQLKNLGIQV